MVAQECVFERVRVLQDAHDLLEQILNSRLAPLAFGLALLLTGQMSTFTGTIAGQVVMSGFMGKRSSTLVRRLGTRALAIMPALAVQLAYGAAGTYKCALQPFILRMHVDMFGARPIDDSASSIIVHKLAQAPALAFVRSGAVCVQDAGHRPSRPRAAAAIHAGAVDQGYFQPHHDGPICVVLAAQRHCLGGI